VLLVHNGRVQIIIDCSQHPTVLIQLIQLYVDINLVIFTQIRNINSYKFIGTFYEQQRTKNRSKFSDQ